MAVSALLLLSCAGGPSLISRQAATSSPPASCPPPRINDAGLTDAQRDQVYQNTAAEGWKCYTAWIASLNPATLSYATLGHGGMTANFGPPEASSLSQAKGLADLIVRGSVVALRPKTDTFGTEVTIAVTQVLKGQAGTTIKVLQASHLEPQDNYQTIVIVDSYAAPLLLPGETVFLFLKSHPQGLIQQTVTGTYYVRGGQIKALQLNPFASKVNRMSPADFVAATAVA